MTIALFPGQGVQAAGMDGGLAAGASKVFDVASQVLGVDVAELCRRGTSGVADLGSTRWAQPAVLTCSVAAFGVLRDTGEAISAVAGHSIGEYPALVVSGVLDLADAVWLVALRAAATDDAAHATPGGMAAVMRAEHVDIEAQAQLFRRTVQQLERVEHPAILAGGDALAAVAAGAADTAGLVALARDLVDLLESHFGKEEAILFPMAQQMLSPDERADVARRMDALTGG